MKKTVYPTVFFYPDLLRKKCQSSLTLNTVTPIPT
jgi:hypothetical protein